MRSSLLGGSLPRGFAAAAGALVAAVSATEGADALGAGVGTGSGVATGVGGGFVDAGNDDALAEGRWREADGAPAALSLSSKMTNMAAMAKGKSTRIAFCGTDACFQLSAMVAARRFLPGLAVVVAAEPGPLGAGGKAAGTGAPA